jgi:preprotein translocase subunit SecG
VAAAREGRIGLGERWHKLTALKYALVALDGVLGIVVLVLIFLHSGKDAGLSSMFGGGGGSIGGSGVVQKNLDRLTIVFSIAFFICSVGLAFVMMRGT